MRILLVEDDKSLAESASRALTTQGWVVDCTDRAEPVQVSLRRDPYDLVILDVGLPGIDGFEALRRVRRDGNPVPILMLTARDSVEDRVRGLNSGADDYLVKPFAMQELIARVRTLTQRHRDADDSLTIGGLRLVPSSRSATVNGQAIKLTPREWDVLELFADRAGKVVSKGQIANRLAELGEEVSDNVIEVYVSRLRPRVEPAGVAIRTIRGFGYLFDLVDHEFAQR